MIMSEKIPVRIAVLKYALSDGVTVEDVDKSNGYYWRRDRFQSIISKTMAAESKTEAIARLNIMFSNKRQSLQKSLASLQDKLDKARDVIEQSDLPS